MTSRPFRLQRLTPAADAMTIGDYPDYASAVTARSEDVFTVAVSGRGARVRVEHRIDGPGGAAGGFCSELQVSAHPSPAELADLRRWLNAVHQT